jgi:predicted aspartyl protease
VNHFGFSPASGPILVDAEISGPLGSIVLKLILDTGATTSVINIVTLRSIGFDPDRALRRITMTTGSGVEQVPLIVLTRLTALGQHRIGFPVVAHSLPPQSAVDGLLGLDFLRGQVLTVDFQAGRITLS